MAEQKKKSGGSKKIGRDVAKGARYRGLHIREKNKIKRILRSSAKEATRYATKHSLTGYLASLV